MRTVIHLIETVGAGGAERVLVDLVRRTDRRRWRCVVVLPWKGGWLFDQLQAERIETLIVRERGSFDLRSLLRSGTIVRRSGAGVIHSHLFGSAVRAGLLARIHRIPAIGTIHGELDLQPGERFHRLKLAIMRGGLRRVVFVSDGLRRACLGPMGLSMAHTAVIHNGVNPREFTPLTGASAFRRELGFSQADFVVGFVGRLQPVKGIEVFLHAAALLNAWPGNYRFVIVGDGDPAYKQAMFDLREKLGLRDKVEFVGFRSDVSHVMGAFDVYALTSKSEGFSLSTIEAMASGVPVVATRCGGPEQILEDGVSGVLAENGSATGVADAIRRLYSDAGERRRMAEAGRAAVLAHFTVDAQVAKYERLYDQMLNEGVKSHALPDSLGSADGGIV